MDPTDIQVRLAQHDEAIAALKHARDLLEADGRETRHMVADLSAKIDAQNAALGTRLDLMGKTWQERLDAFRQEEAADNEAVRDKLDTIRMDQAKALERSHNAVPTPVQWLLRIVLVALGVVGGALLAAHR